MKTREAYKHYLSLKALTQCVFPPPWPTFRWWYLRKGLEDKRDHTTGPTDISFSFNNPSLLSPILFYLSVRAWHELYMPAHGFHFPFPLTHSLLRCCPTSYPSLQCYLSPLCHPVTHAFFCYSAAFTFPCMYHSTDYFPFVFVLSCHPNLVTKYSRQPWQKLFI